MISPAARAPIVVLHPDAAERDRWAALARRAADPRPVVAVADGAEALALATHCLPFGVILPLRVPGWRLEEFLADLADRLPRPRVPIVALLPPADAAALATVLALAERRPIATVPADASSPGTLAAALRRARDLLDSSRP